MFGFLEKNPFFFTLAFVVAFAIAGIVEILPNFFKSARPIEGLRPYTVLETAGRQVYIKEGCYNCHSQLIRPFQAEVQRYGAYSLSGEYAYDRPFLWGSRRIGPDLHRVGDVRTTAWHEKHMLDPLSVVPGSIMPAYKHLFSKDSDFETAFAEAYTQKKVFGVPYDTPNGVKLGDIKEAKKLFLEQAQTIVNDMQNPQIKEALKQGKVKEIVALIAYLNSLGQARVLKPQATSFNPSKPDLALAPQQGGK
ncbi:Cbb3-type cytochrome c oxidase subunit II FixO [Helicobacter bizzozeronii]|uniref:cytochrome-c oxidase, cbb3-type subunit II n=1 Tax=Helicobacter bizzozeronii TaxID=56877 RepID=UPI00244D81DA|nr:cytochrome-c oxidase, cbb3-type subunit II [Helicobacter bizzozeronii]GMB93040.1 Cbb3-type cytochrome c oxidase subunit II FixO [Helicobacter bizzozeronii]